MPSGVTAHMTYVAAIGPTVAGRGSRLSVREIFVMLLRRSTTASPLTFAPNRWVPTIGTRTSRSNG